MAVITQNSNNNPMILRGCLTTSEVECNQSYYPDGSNCAGTILNLYDANQVVGLVPVFPCVPDDCRLGNYKADSIPNDTQFTLPVFAEESFTSDYKNDFNSFLFNCIGAGTTGFSYNMSIEKLISGSWVKQDDLDDNTYGTFYDVGSLCSSLQWKGYSISWAKVLNVLGIGTYRLKYIIQPPGYITSSCFASPPFCLLEFDCYKADRTSRFDSTILGGLIGNVNKKNAGSTWTFCCPDTSGREIKQDNPVQWLDSIRVEGMFGFEDTDSERKSLKYTTGQVKKIRDENILKFKWKAGSLPFWFHARFKSYGLQSDELLVSDYNINNPDYDIKLFSVQWDSSYNPDYKNYSRYQKVTCEFKAAIQNLKRTRCC